MLRANFLLIAFLFSSYLCGQICQDYTILSDSSEGKSRPEISKNHVVWSGLIQNGNKGIWLFDLNSDLSPIVISNDSINNQAPKIFENYIVWHATVENKDEIFLFDISSGSSPINISNNPEVNDRYPEVHGEYVVWSSSNFAVSVYSIQTGMKTEIINNGIGSTFSGIEIIGDYVVWSGFNAIGATDIYLYSISNGGTPVNISNNSPNNDVAPQIHGDYVVWQGFNGIDDEIWLYSISNGGAPINISNNPGRNDVAPQIHGDYVVWRGSKTDVFSFEIQLHSISEGGSSLTIPNTKGNNSPNIWGDFIVSTDQYLDIVLHSISEIETSIKLTNTQDYIDLSPKIEENNIVWFRSDYFGDTEILHFECDLISNLENDENLFEQISVFPNPVSENLLLENTGEKVFRIALYDLHGTLLKSLLNPKNINVSELSNGIYFAQISDMNNSNVVTKKIIVNHSL